MHTPTHRKQLNDLQIEILLILYKFRFATKDLIVDYQELSSNSYTHYRLENLVAQEYISRNYDSSYKLLHKPATYFIASKGIRFLYSQATELDLNKKVLNLMYKDKNTAESYTARCLTLFRIYLTFRKIYGHNLNFSTKSELNEYDHFLRPRPDAYLTLEGKHKATPDCFLEFMISNDVPFFAHARRIASYVRHFNSGSWQTATGTEYPRLLLVCDTPDLERRVKKATIKSLSTLPYPFQAYTTTAKALFNSMSAKETIWTDVLSDDQPVALWTKWIQIKSCMCGLSSLASYSGQYLTSEADHQPESV